MKKAGLKIKFKCILYMYAFLSDESLLMCLTSKPIKVFTVFELTVVYNYLEYSIYTMPGF